MQSSAESWSDASVPSSTRNLPDGQIPSHEVWPDVSAYVPAAQIVHELPSFRYVPFRYVPAVQDAHWSALAWSEAWSLTMYLPSSHEVQVTLPEL